MPFSPAALLAGIREHLPASASGSLCVAFSGGLDSTVLLYALAHVIRDQPAWSLRALHVDHQLHERSALWEQHCAAAAQGLGVEYQSVRVTVPADRQQGLESSARTARYAALRELLRPGEALITAHHSDDQLETVLLALARGAGLRGLSAMPVCQAMGSGWHLRPLLEFSREALQDWARTQALAWIADPSNDDSRFSRNFLRNEIIPALQERWPAIAESAVRSAKHLGEGASLLDGLAVSDLSAAAAGECLRVAVLVSMTPGRRRNLLRYWVRTLGARAPSTRKLLALEHDMLKAQEDRLPVIDWEGFEVRRHRGLLYGSHKRSFPDPVAPAGEWDWRSPLQLPNELGRLRTEIAQGSGLDRSRLPPKLHVDFRHGGETLRPAGQAHHRKLKKLLHDSDILPWWRSRVPLIRSGDALIAVGDLWIADEFAAAAGCEGLRIIWEERPVIEAMTP